MRTNVTHYMLGFLLGMALILSAPATHAQKAVEQPALPEATSSENGDEKNLENKSIKKKPEPEKKQKAEQEPSLSDEADQVEDAEREKAISDIEVPEISYDLQALPFPTRRMHELILEATKSGEIEKLRALIGVGDSATQLSLGGFDGDAIDFLKSQSGDEKGHEILAILEEVLEAGYVHLDKGTDRELFVWPYFFAVPIDTLTDKQRVELFRIVTYGDFLEFKDFGGYIFYRVGISPAGRWEFFVAGD